MISGRSFFGSNTVEFMFLICRLLPRKASHLLFWGKGVTVGWSGSCAHRLRLPAGLPAGLRQSIQNALPVGIVEEDVFAPMAWIHDACPAVARRFPAKADGKFGPNTLLASCAGVATG